MTNTQNIINEKLNDRNVLEIVVFSTKYNNDKNYQREIDQKLIDKLKTK